MTRRIHPSFGKGLPVVLAIFIFLSAGLPSAMAQTAEMDKKKEGQGKTVKITEEILVVGKIPKEIPLATVSTLTATEIERIKPRDLSELVKYVPGCLVTFGDKDTYSLKLRGIDSRRIALLVDGIPVYEPYFSTFDLKTVSAGGIDTLQVTKGPSSVLYGPNTLGGIVNVITLRPSDRPYLSLMGSLGDGRSRSLGLDTSYSWTRFALSANVLHQDSRAFYYPDKAEGRTERLNSDFERLNLSAKLYYTPSASTEIMVNGSLYQSEYGMPAALSIQRIRYWRFPKWDRSSLNVGGFTSFGGDSFLRFRAYYVNYINTLDWFNDLEMTELDSQSTYDNSVYGAFAMADLGTGGSHRLKASFLAQLDVARIQDDAGLPWEKVDQGTFSVGLEDHISLGDHWKVIGGLSFDHIDKFEGGENDTSLNPLAGIKFTPREELDFHISFARKSKFPSMRSLYSTSSGNPDLLAESGTSLEFSAAYNKGVFLTGSVFLNRFRNFIDSVRLPDGTRRYYNVGKARINGFEIQAQKSLPWFSGTVNYTFVGHENITEGRPLDAQSKHNANFDASFFPMIGFRIGVNGIYGSESFWYDSVSTTVLSIPAYFNMDAIASFSFFSRYELFIKLGNAFNRYFFTEPGFPWRGRYLEIGFRADVLR